MGLMEQFDELCNGVWWQTFYFVSVFLLLPLRKSVFLYLQLFVAALCTISFLFLNRLVANYI